MFFIPEKWGSLHEGEKIAERRGGTGGIKSSLFKISSADLYRIEQPISAGRDLHDHPVQLSDHFRAGQKLKQVIEGIVQIPLK